MLPHSGSSGNAIPKTLRHWHRLTAQALHPSFESTVEEFSPILQAFRAAQADGHIFDRGTVNLMAMLERQAIGSDDDTDQDLSVDDGQEFDDAWDALGVDALNIVASVDARQVTFKKGAA